MSKRMTLCLVAGVDIWVILFVLHQQPAANSDVLLAMKARTQSLNALNEPVEVWLTKDAIGFYPDVDRPMTVDQLRRQIELMAASGDLREVRLLCDRSLTIDEWKDIAEMLSMHTEQLRLAPLPPQ